MEMSLGLLWDQIVATVDLALLAWIVKLEHDSLALEKANHKLYKTFFEERARWYAVRGKESAKNAGPGLSLGKIGAKRPPDTLSAIPVIEASNAQITEKMPPKNDSGNESISESLNAESSLPMGIAVAVAEKDEKNS